MNFADGLMVGIWTGTGILIGTCLRDWWRLTAAPWIVEQWRRR